MKMFIKNFLYEISWKKESISYEKFHFIFVFTVLSTVSIWVEIATVPFKERKKCRTSVLFGMKTCSNPQKPMFPFLPTRISFKIEWQKIQAMPKDIFNAINLNKGTNCK